MTEGEKTYKKDPKLLSTWGEKLSKTTHPEKKK